MEIGEVRTKENVFKTKKTSLGFKVLDVAEDRIKEVRRQIKEKLKMNIETLQNEKMVNSYYK